jgi:hypothetical protein
MVGPVSRHLPLTLQATYSLWVRRARDGLDDVDDRRRTGQPSVTSNGASPKMPLCPGDRVQRGPQWAGEEADGGMGQSGSVVSVAGNSVVVQWDRGIDKIAYRQVPLTD